jgi:DNA-binding transcriptional regulator YhcF (GntR family)
MKLLIDPDSPVPLYHQIAEALRWQMTRGSLQPGDALPTLREAAKEWGVNLHTIRHAYTELARDGLVESRPSTGTRVLGRSDRPSMREQRWKQFLGRMVAEADRKFAVKAPELARALLEFVPSRKATTSVGVVECSLAQCEDLAQQLEQQYRVDALPWSLSEEEDLPDLPILATYFHYNEIRRRWPRRLQSIAFASIRPAPPVLQGLERGAAPPTVLVCERDEATAQTVLADLLALPGADHLRLRKKVVRRAAQALAAKSRAPLLFSPRTWAELSEEQRADPRTREIRYFFDPDELAGVARRFRLVPRKSGSRSASRAS